MAEGEKASERRKLEISLLSTSSGGAAGARVEGNAIEVRTDRCFLRFNIGHLASRRPTARLGRRNEAFIHLVSLLFGKLAEADAGVKAPPIFLRFGSQGCRHDYSAASNSDARKEWS